MTSLLKAMEKVGPPRKQVFRELPLIMTGRGWKHSCRGLKLLINIWLGSQTNFQLKEHVYKQVFCLNCPLTRVSSLGSVSR